MSVSVHTIAERTLAELSAELVLEQVLVGRREVVVVTLERRFDALVVEFGKHVHELCARVRLIRLAHLAVDGAEGHQRVWIQLEN